MKRCTPIISFEMMKGIEELAFSRGVAHDQIMQSVGRKIALWVNNFLTKSKLPGRICVFAGKGKNGADSLWAALFLAQEHAILVTIVLPFERVVLCEESKTLLKRLESLKVRICTPEEETDRNFSVIIDGLLGSGCVGEVQEPLLHTIDMINEMKGAVVSVDIPSGLGEGTTVYNHVVRADFTLYVGFPKKCFFEKDAWEHVGVLVGIPIPEFEPYYERGKFHEFLVEERWLYRDLKVSRNIHKYEAGYLLLIAGSAGMQGAAKLVAEAAYRSGCGIVRLFGEPVALAEVITAPRDIMRFQEELQRASCVCIGPGLGRDSSAEKFFEEVIAKYNTAPPGIPLVLDADALILLKKLNLAPPIQAILTPHFRELIQLLGVDKDIDEQMLYQKASSYAKTYNVTLICKGSPTRIYLGDGTCYISPFGDPAMATAGMGDVLSGVLSGFLCRKIPSSEAAILGVYLHAQASLHALERWGMFHLLASDCLRELSTTIAEFFGRTTR